MGKKKPRPKAPTAPGNIKVDGVVNQVISAINEADAPAPLLKICRLCEAKDGPFLNIFGVEQGIAQKIAVLMPFKVSEYDDLPHNICFRCSAKVEELHDFVNKCVKAQESLQKALGNKKIQPTKSETRKIWEETLNQSNMSNDEICDAVIKQAMKGIVDFPPSPPQPEEPMPPPSKNKSTVTIKSTNTSRSHSPAMNESVAEKTLPYTKPKRSSVPEKLPEPVPQPEPEIEPKKLRKRPTKPEPQKVIKVTDIQKLMEPKTKNVSENNDNSNGSDESELRKLMEAKPTPAPVEKEVSKPFNIQDYICTIKVNGVGTLHQCSLCNRNFLNEEVILNHGCARNGVPKKDIMTSNARPTIETYKNPMACVKYINNRISESKTVETPVEEKPVNVEPPIQKPKPKIGPASRVQKGEASHISHLVGMKVAGTKNPTPPATTLTPPPTLSIAPKPQFIPTIDIPGMTNRYRLVPGPNNTFTLIEDPPRKPEPNTNPTPAPVKRKPSTETPLEPVVIKKHKRDKGKGKKPLVPEILDNVIELDDDPPETSTPYPVGLFQSAGQRDSAPPVTFTTPAMKKQSYQVVQTGNPSKLLISAKPQPQLEPPRPPKMKKKKEVREPEKQPFTVTLEDVEKEKDQAFFTFVNVDPLLQPAYVLPTDNIIQESQISTSSAVAAPPNPNKPYSCNLCSETFSREKKLLVHIQAHYNKMDEEDNSRFEKPKRTRRSQ